MNFKRSIFLVSALAFMISLDTISRADVVIDFTDLSLPTNSYFNGGPSSSTAGWNSGTVHFGNEFDSTYSVWNGFAYSNVNDPGTSGFGNQYAAITGTGVGGSGIYALAYNSFDGDQSFINLPNGFSFKSVQVTNTAYAYYSMKLGDQFAKKFGGAGGSDPDYFRVNFTGYDQLDGVGAVTGNVKFSLADFTSGNNSLDYIISSWTNVDLTSLGLAKSLRLSFESSDVGLYGINTPTYAAFDNFVITAVPEPSSFALVVLAGFALNWRRRKEQC